MITSKHTGKWKPGEVETMKIDYSYSYFEPVNAAIKLDSDKFSIMSNENCFLFISMLKLKTVKGLIHSSAINRIRRILWYC